MSCLYNHLCETKRYMITFGLQAGHSIRQIALSLNRSASSISRELRRNGSAENCYDAVLADKYAKERRHKPRREKRLDVHRGLRHYVTTKLNKYWSPQQIGGRLIKDFPNDKGMRISHETIYAYIYALPKSGLRQELIAKLRRKHPQRFRNGRNPSKNVSINAAYNQAGFSSSIIAL